MDWAELLVPANRAGPICPKSPSLFLLTSPGHNSNNCPSSINKISSTSYSDCKTQLVIFFFGLFAGDLLRQLSPPKPAPTPALSRSPTQNQRQHRRKNTARRFSRVSQQIDALRAHHLPEKYMSPFLFILPPQRDPVSSSGRHLPILSRTKDH